MQYPEVFPNLCLAGMDFHLPGLDESVLSLFINIKGKDCSGINLIAANLERARLEGASLNRARLDGARLDGARLDVARLGKASLDGANLDGANLDGANLDGANLDGASLKECSLKKTVLDKSILNEANLHGASLDVSRLNGSNLYNADLCKASFISADLEGAIFTYNTDSNINWDDLKSKGGVILYFTESKRKNHICMQLAKGENTFSYMVPDNVDIEKIQQENPDWEISIIK